MARPRDYRRHAGGEQQHRAGHRRWHHHRCERRHRHGQRRHHGYRWHARARQWHYVGQRHHDRAAGAHQRHGLGRPQRHHPGFPARFAGSLTLSSGANFSPGTTGAGLTTNTNALTFDVGSTYPVGSGFPQGFRYRGGRGRLRPVGENTGGNLSLTSSALLTLTLSLVTPDQGSPFWNTNHSWAVVSSTGGGTITGTALHLANDQSAWAGRGSFTTRGQRQRPRPSSGPPPPFPSPRRMP